MLFVTQEELQRFIPQVEIWKEFAGNCRSSSIFLSGIKLALQASPKHAVSSFLFHHFITPPYRQTQAKLAHYLFSSRRVLFIDLMTVSPSFFCQAFQHPAFIGSSIFECQRVLIESSRVRLYFDCSVVLNREKNKVLNVFA